MDISSNHLHINIPLSLATWQTTPKLNALKQWLHLFFSWICNLGRAWQGQFVFASQGISGVAWDWWLGPSANSLTHRLPGDAGWEPGQQLGCGQNTSTGPFPVAAWPPTTVVAGFQRQTCQEKRNKVKAASSFVIIWEVIQDCFCHILFVRSKSLRPATSKGRGIRLHLLLARISKNLWTCFKTSQSAHWSWIIYISPYM